MDNHADNLIVNKNYIAGLIDSDFGVNIKRFYPRGRLQLRPDITFSNTRYELIEVVSKFLGSYGINHYVGLNKATIGRDKKYISISRFTKCIEFIELFRSYSIVRRPQMGILYEFCDDRFRYINDYGWKQNNTPYTDHQKSLFDKIVRLNLDYNRDEGYRNYTSSWLSGFLDGDGSIGFIITKSMTEKVLIHSNTGIYNDKIITPFISFCTGSDLAKNNITELFDNYGVKHTVKVRVSKAKKRVGKNKKKFYYGIDVRTFEDLRKLIDILDGHLVAKQSQLNLLKEYLDRRKTNRYYTNEDFDIVETVKNLNTNY